MKKALHERLHWENLTVTLTKYTYVWQYITFNFGPTVFLGHGDSIDIFNETVECCHCDSWILSFWPLRMVILKVRTGNLTVRTVILTVNYTVNMTVVILSCWQYNSLSEWQSSTVRMTILNGQNGKTELSLESFFTIAQLYLVTWEWCHTNKI